MPISKNQKTNILNTLRILYDRQPIGTTTQSFSEIVKGEVLELTKSGNIICTNWETSCQNNRDTHHISYTQMAEIIGVTRESIHDMENRSTVDPFYLECYCLIFQKYPHELLGCNKPANHIFPAMWEASGITDKCINLILNMSFSGENPTNLDKLIIISKIGKLTTEAYRNLMNAMKLLKFDRYIPADAPLTRSQGNNISWTAYWKKCIFNSSKFLDEASFASSLDYLFWDTFLLLRHLETYHPTRLLKLANIVSGDEKVMIFLKTLMMEIDYPGNSNQFIKYDSELLSSILPNEQMRRIYSEFSEKLL